MERQARKTNGTDGQWHFTLPSTEYNNFSSYDKMSPNNTTLEYGKLLSAWRKLSTRTKWNAFYIRINDFKLTLLIKHPIDKKKKKKPKSIQFFYSKGLLLLN